MELLGHMVVLCLVFEGASVLQSIVAAPVYIPSSSVGGFPSLQLLLFVYFLIVAILTHVG